MKCRYMYTHIEYYKPVLILDHIISIILILTSMVPIKNMGLFMKRLAYLPAITILYSCSVWKSVINKHIEKNENKSDSMWI